MIKQKIQIFSLFVITILTSCTKNDPHLSRLNFEKNTISEIKKIVGNNGTIIVSNYNLSPNLLNTNTSLLTFDKSCPVNLTIDQFKQIYNSLKDGHMWKDTIENILDTGNTISGTSSNIISFSDDFYEDENGPIQNGRIKAGYHKVQFYPTMPGIGYSGINKSFSQIMNLHFNINSFGYVEGSPAISFSGLALFSFSQNYISPIQKYSGYSMFTIGGTAEFGLNVANLGWNSPVDFTVKIYTNGKIEIILNI
jgi:hypothetical protein